MLQTPKWGWTRARRHSSFPARLVLAATGAVRGSSGSPRLWFVCAKALVLSGMSSDVPLLRARALKLPRSLPPQLSDNSQVVGADRDLVVDKKAVEETAEFYDARLLWCQGPHDLMLDPVGLVVVCVFARSRALSLTCGTLPVSSSLKEAERGGQRAACTFICPFISLSI